MNKALELLDVKPKDFPLEVTMSSGEKHFLSAPLCLKLRPGRKNLVLFPDNGFLEIISLQELILIKRRARRPKEPIDKSLGALKVKPKDFPLELTMSSDEKHFLSAPKHLKMRPDGERIVLFPDNGFLEIIRPHEVISIKRHARRLKAG